MNETLKFDYTIGVDLGGTKLDIGVVDNLGNIKDHTLVFTDVQGGFQAILNQIADATQELTQRQPIAPTAVGVGLPGQIDADTGVVSFAPNLKWKNVPFKEELQKRLALPVAVTNDVRAATWGEWVLGSGKGYQDILCIFVGTGIGGGIVNKGRILNGDTNSAGEIGHMTIAMGGRECHCGNRGCFEAYAGGWAIEKRTKELVAERGTQEGREILALAGGNIKDITSYHLAEAYQKGNGIAREVIEELIEALISGSMSIVNAFNPKMLIFGGGVIKGMPQLLIPVLEGIKKRALPAATRNLEIKEAHLKTHAGIVGAAVFGLNEIKNEEKR